MVVRLRDAAAGCAAAGRPARVALGLARPGNHDGRDAALVQRLRTAVSAAVRSPGACSGGAEQAAARAHLQRDAAGKSLSRGCRFVSGRSRTAADVAGHSAPDGARLEAAEADRRSAVRSERLGRAGCRAVAHAARPLRWTNGRGARGLQRRTERRRALDPAASRGSGRVDREHSVQRDAHVRAAHPLAQPRVQLAQNRRAAEGRRLAGLSGSNSQSALPESG